VIDTREELLDVTLEDPGGAGVVVGDLVGESSEAVDSLVRAFAQPAGI